MTSLNIACFKSDKQILDFQFRREAYYKLLSSNIKIILNDISGHIILYLYFSFVSIPLEFLYQRDKKRYTVTIKKTKMIRILRKVFNECSNWVVCTLSYPHSSYPTGFTFLIQITYT